MGRILAMAGALLLAQACGGGEETPFGTTGGTTTATGTVGTTGSGGTTSGGGTETGGTTPGGGTETGGTTPGGGTETGGTTPGGGTGTGGTTPGGGTGFNGPQSGLWDYEEGGIVEDPCGLEAAAAGLGAELLVQPDGPMEVANNGDGTFDVTPVDSGEPFTCTLSGMDFTCTERVSLEVDLSDMGVSAVLVFRAAAEGTFLSETEATGEQVAVVDCTGADCAMAASVLGVTFPCDLVAVYDAIYNDKGGKGGKP